MFDFLKTFGQGLLYLVLSPFLLIIAAVYTIYCVFLFIYYFIKRIVMFFLGYNMKDEMKIDKLAKLHLNNIKEEEEVKEAVNPTPVIEKTIIQQVFIAPDQNGNYRPINIGNPLEYTKLENQVINQIQTKQEEETVKNEEEDEYDEY